MIYIIISIIVVLFIALVIFSDYNVTHSTTIDDTSDYYDPYLEHIKTREAEFNTAERIKNK